VTYHFNNLELLGQKGPDFMRSLFEKIRDVLQEPDVYFVFVGYKGMFQQVIVPSERVRSIFFDTPVYLNPLDFEEIKSIIERRYELLALPDKKWIRPVDEKVVLHLNHIFSGKIRYVMNAITTLINRIPESYSQSLGVEKALEILSSLLASELRKNLPEEAARMFFIAIELRRFTNSSYVKISGKSKQSVNKYIRLFLKYEYIHLTEIVGRNRFYEIDPQVSGTGKTIRLLQSHCYPTKFSSR